MASAPEALAPAKRSAKAAGLAYVSDEDSPGIRRRRQGRGFAYLDQKGMIVGDKKTLARIKALVIPPAWNDVWICPAENGHLQASGRDAAGRKQYLYHDDWRRVRDETKYGRLLAFAKALPQVRRAVARDLRRKQLDRRKVLATIVKLLDVTYLRIGNDEYARGNDSYGLTTLRDKHADVRGERLRLEFPGKSGKPQSVDVHDRRLAKIVGRCQDLPGQTLFQYLDENDERQSVGSADVNAYLRETADADFTAKDFRTWAGTVLAAAALGQCEPAASDSAAKRTIAEMVRSVAERLGNTPAICRKCYIHPAVIEAYQNGATSGRAATNGQAEKHASDSVTPRRGTGLDACEKAAVRLLRQGERRQ